MGKFDIWADSNLSTLVQRVNQVSRGINTASQSFKRTFDLGDIPGLRRALHQIESSTNDLAQIAHDVRIQTESYDAQRYLQDQFDSELRQAMTDAGLPLEGTYPNYFIVPVRLSVDARLGRVRVNRRLLSGLRLSHIVETVAQERDRIRNRPFNARQFILELGGAYDDLVTIERAHQGIDASGHALGLKRIYERLTPRREWRSQYTEVFFSYDLHRLLSSDETHLTDGRRYFLSPARNSRLNLNILDPNQRPIQYGVVAFRKE